MPMPLSQETREKIIYHKEAGATNAEISKWLMVSTDSVKRIWKRYKKENTIKPQEHKRGRKPAFDDKVMKQITAKIKEQPDITLEELIEIFELKISVSALCRKLLKLNMTFKKRRYFPKNSSARTYNGYGVNG